VNFGNSPEKNEFALPEESSGLSAQHFQIYYEKKQNEYFLKDSGEGTGTFIKITQKTVFNLLIYQYYISL